MLLRLILGACYLNKLDILGYHLPWAISLSEGGLLQGYLNTPSLDYPPMFPTFLWILGQPIVYAAQMGMQHLLMFLLKLVPILFDAGTVVAVYLLLKKEDKRIALMGSAIWALNISAIFNCAFWGQSDCMMLFFIFLTFAMLWKEKPVAGTVFFALGCLCKLQMCYFAPVVLLELVCYYPVKQWLKATVIGLATFIAGWLPFMIGSGNAILPFHVYFGGFSSYNYVNLNAMNVYGILPGLNFMPESTDIFGNVTFATLSTVFTALILAGLVAWYIAMKKTGKRVPAFVPATLYMYAIFMLTTQMHERYQIPVLMLSFLCWIYYRTKAFLTLFYGVMGVTFINQMTFLFQLNYHGWFETAWPTIQCVFSCINVLLFVYAIWLICWQVWKKKTPHRIPKIGETEWED